MNLVPFDAEIEFRHSNAEILMLHEIALAMKVAVGLFVINSKHYTT